MVARANRTIGVLGRIDSLLRPLFDWFTGLPPEEAAEFRDDLLATVMMRPSALLLSSLGVLLMSGSAMVLTEARWAVGWFAFDLAVLAIRAVPTFHYARRRQVMPCAIARLLICLVFLLFLIFSIGCAASVMSQQRPLTMVATASMMGVVAGLSTRWSALPRLAMPAILLFTTPFCIAVAIAGDGGLRTGAVQFALLAAGTAALGIQNHANLIALVRAERRNRALAETDSLTGLANRAGLIAEVDRLRAHVSAGTQIATLFIDLDSFKAINDQHGHPAGDRVLTAVGARLREAAAPHFACRLGGDEFVVLIEGPDHAIATFIARRIAERIGEPIADCGADPITIGASVGVAFGTIANRTAEQILADADVALYLAKEAGGGQHAVGDPRRASA